MKTNLEKILSLLSSSYSVYHVVDNIRKELQEAGFEELDEKENFHLKKGHNYYLTRNSTSILAFKIPSEIEDLHFQITATHNDSPSFKLKPSPMIRKGNLLMLDTEPYGGGIYNTWMDKPLSLAGRVLVREGNTIHTYLLNIDKDLLIIPNVAIHMNREINKGYNYNPAVDLLPLFSETTQEENFDFNQYLLEQLHLREGEVLSHDLFLYNREKPTLLGRNREFLASPREDDLSSTYTALLGFINSKETDHISLYTSFDNEEVGSLTRQGANSTFLKDNLSRIIQCLGTNKDDREKAYARSMMLSIDNAHANHPNHPEYSDQNTHVELNKGIVIKYNANQSYTSDGISSSVVKTLCREKNIPYQEFTNRSDLRGGSTLGNLSESEVSLTTVDIGLPQLAMHSSYETMGRKDIDSMVDLVDSFFSKDILFEKDSVIIR